MKLLIDGGIPVRSRNRCGIHSGPSSLLQGAVQKRRGKHSSWRWSRNKCDDRLTAENAKLRVALAAGEMTEEGKKVAAMTMAALDAVIGPEEVA